jgi:coenzyme F420-reducing hydrogenase gamma subunit
LERKFKDEQYMDAGSEVPSDNLPQILDKLEDNHKHIKVDVDLPGCPPVAGNIIGLISSLLGNVDANIDTSKSMCDVCPLETCLLLENKICFGPITAVGESFEQLKMGYPILGEFGLTPSVHADNAMKLLNKLTANPLTKKEIQQTVEAMLLLLKGPVALGYLDGRKDPIRQTKLAPDKVKMKKIADPVDVDKRIEVADVKMDDYPDVVNDILGACLAELKNNPEYDESAKTICSSCPNNVQDKSVESYKRDFEGFSDPHKCLLIQGYVCMGPITRAGCGTLCPKANTPCSGCYGPALNVGDYGAKALSYFPSICKDSPENIKAFFKDPVGVFNRFTTASSKLGNQVREKGGKE